MNGTRENTSLLGRQTEAVRQMLALNQVTSVRILDQFHQKKSFYVAVNICIILHFLIFDISLLGLKTMLKNLLKDC